MLLEIDDLISKYYQWLKVKTSLREIGSSVEITTPYLDSHNDYIQLYVKKDTDGYVITDDGYTIQDLRQMGCDLNTSTRKSILESTLNGFGVKKEGDEILIKTNAHQFSLKKHNLIQAVLGINDLFYTSQAYVGSLLPQNPKTPKPRVK